jgi:hypothetical protein
MLESGSSGLANSSSAIADNTSEIDILFLKYGTFTKILLQYSLDLFNPSSLDSVSSTTVHLIYCYEPVVTEPCI